MMVLFNEEYIQQAYGHEQREEGRAEGKSEECRKFVLGLKAQNIPVEIIAKAAEITVEEVRAIFQQD